jgi:hypothetical protein
MHQLTILRSGDDPVELGQVPAKQYEVRCGREHVGFRHGADEPAILIAYELLPLDMLDVGLRDVSEGEVLALLAERPLHLIFTETNGLQEIIVSGWRQGKTGDALLVNTDVLEVPEVDVRKVFGQFLLDFGIEHFPAALV